MPPSKLVDHAGSQELLRVDASGQGFQEMCNRARDEASRLREETCALRTRVEELEEERNFHATKASELTSLINTIKTDGANAALVKKVMQVADLKIEIQKLKKEKEDILQENVRFQRQRDCAHKELEDLSVVVRSLQTSVYAEDEAFEPGDEEEEEEIVLTAEKALDMTLGNMKAHIEVLEDALQAKAAQYKECKKKAFLLQKDNEVNIVKIEMLEELFRELNQNRSEEAAHVTTVPIARETTVGYEMSVSVPSRKIGERLRRSFGGKENESSVASPATNNSVESTHRPGGQMKNLKICFRKAGLEGIYTGPVKDGLPHGVGTIRFTNGDTYLGEMYGGKMSGKGALYTKSRGIFRGRFENNKFVA
ncbi:hypothetical protein IV203_013143 [Nitzschia inconspicua]|uniref:MORN repeat-containing protein n=1 Tax=Nitzschia inconspicua TaxID=303405 RepID=A0A9K3M4J9_9STRA|nr:hypothetical protein IV203_013143 [Nitzschia inconspicua]